MGVLPTGEWKFLFLDNGVQYATIAGITKMLKLCVVCWDTGKKLCQENIFFVAHRESEIYIFSQKIYGKLITSSEKNPI